MATLLLPDYTPVYPVTKTIRPRQRIAKLPDWGIEQRGTQGQNQTAPEWNLKWILTPAQANDLDSFLAARAKSGEWFLWTSPSGAAGRYRCDDWSKTLTYCDIYEVQATFRQVFDIRVDAVGDGLMLSIAALLTAGAADGESDWGLITQATAFSFDYGLVTASVIAAEDWGTIT